MPSSVPIALLAALTLCVHLPTMASAYCWRSGQNPGWSAPPRVEQISSERVRVSWSDGQVTNRRCADNFVVKFWPRSAPSRYEVTPLVPVDDDDVEVAVAAAETYMFQAVAREDKGLVGGVDWNKSPTVAFATSLPTEAPPTTEAPTTETPTTQTPITTTQSSSQIIGFIGDMWQRLRTMFTQP